MPRFITAAPGWWMLWLTPDDGQGANYLKDPIIAWEVSTGFFTAVIEIKHQLADPGADEFLGLLSPEGRVTAADGTTWDWYATLGLR